MKKYFYLTLLITSLQINNTFAQAKDVSPFNKFALDLNVGAAKPFHQFTPGYRTPTFGFVHVDLGGRYMLNDKFGMKAEFGYNTVKNASESKEFNNRLIRFNIQGVANLTNTLNFHDFCDKFGLLFHGGIGVASLRNDNSDGVFNWKDNQAAEMLSFMFGFTPQYKINDNFSINLDWTLTKSLYQNRTFDMNSKTGVRGFDGTMASLSLGISYFFGKANKAADWYIKSPSGKSSELDALDKRLKDAERRIKEINK
jgi:OmpA-OmpF porin, OOP family